MRVRTIYTSRFTGFSLQKKKDTKRREIVRKSRRFGNNALGMAVNDLYDHSHYISAHVDAGYRKVREERERERRQVERRRGKRCRAVERKSDGGQRRWVRVVLSREKPNRLPRDCGAMADS